MARNVALALCLLGAFVASATQPNPPPDCWQYNSCSNCTTAPSGQCGWDAANSLCKQGTASGPKEGSTEQWWWLTAQCCAANTHCTDCTTSNGYCGWDVNQGKCMRGNYWGPAVGQSQSWVAESDACPSQCQQSSDCSSCIETTGCVWVENVRQCVSGNTNGNGPYWNQAVIQGLGQQGAAVVWYSDSCPSNWGLRWSTNSYSLWCIAGSVGFTFLLATAAMGRRRRRLLREQRLRMGGYAAQPQTQQAQPQAAVGAPLLSQGAPDIQQGYPAHPIYGQPAPMPYYGATPEEYTESKPIY